MIKALIFDCFGVLYVDPGRLFFETEVSHYASIQREVEDLRMQADYGYLSQDELNTAIASLAQVPVEIVREKLLAPTALNQPLLDFAQSYRPGLKIGLLSNTGTEAMNRYFTPQQRDELFDATVLSSEVGITKPHPDIFKMTAERLGATPGECVMIDDLEANCAGADAAGMQSVLYTGAESTKKALAKLLI
jgi:HAD superfamily hydrolase (TIGR01509 family)